MEVRHIQHIVFNIIFTVPTQRHGFITRPLHVGISGRQSGTGTCFPPTTSVFPIPPVLFTHISVIWTGTINTYRYQLTASLNKAVLSLIQPST